MTASDSIRIFALLFVFICGLGTLCADPPPDGRWKPVPALTDELMAIS
jgi:hypothetical protein